MNAAELNLAFAREVAGYPNAFWAGDYLDNGSAQRLPDYTRDWNAVIFEIQERGLKWGADYDAEGLKFFWCDASPFSASAKCYTGPDHRKDCTALARAVLECVRAMKIAERKYNDRENPE